MGAFSTTEAFVDMRTIEMDDMSGRPRTSLQGPLQPYAHSDIEGTPQAIAIEQCLQLETPVMAGAFRACLTRMGRAVLTDGGANIAGLFTGCLARMGQVPLLIVMQAVSLDGLRYPWRESGAGGRARTC
jgi:hypothetical protein